MTPQREIISLDEARLLREQLKPAFAGYTTDGNISDRDVLGTVMDLIVRDYIGIDLDTQAVPNKVRSLYLVNWSQNLLPFEKGFLRVLFAGSRSIGVKAFTKKVQSGVLHQVILENTLALVETRIARQILLVLDKEDHRKEVTYLTQGGTVVRVKTVGDLVDLKNSGEEIASELSRQFLVLILVIASLSLVFYGLVNFTISSSANSDIIGIVGYPLGFILLFIVLVMIIGVVFRESLSELPFTLFRLLDYVGNKKELKQTKNLLLLQFRDNVAPYVKSRYEELFDFIRSHPLKQQRIYNEFMPHAVAFGLDTSWNDSFGIGIEPVVASRIRGRAPPWVEQQVRDEEVRWLK
jgi:hypothetical protein